MKKYLTAGLLVWLPLAATFWILDVIVQLSDTFVQLLPETWQPTYRLGVDIPGLGLVLAFVVILVTGMITANFLGQKLVTLWEKLLSTIPVVRPIYGAVKKITGTLLTSNTTSFQEVVYVQYPQKDHWTLAFIVNHPNASMQQALNVASHRPNAGHDWITVYVPTAPNPTSGYVLLVSSKDIHRSDLSVDDALKFHLSLGVLSPSMPSDIQGNKSDVPPTST